MGLWAAAAPILGAVGSGLVGSLFGSDEDEKYMGGYGNQGSSAPTLWPGLDNYASGFLGDASSIYNQGGFAPGTNPLQLLGRQNQLGYAEGALPGLIGNAQASWQRGLNPGLDPYVGAMIEAGHNDLTQDFQRNIMPAISDRAQAVGGYGGSRQGVAQGIAAEGLMEAQGDISARLMSQAYQDSLRQQQAAWAASPQMAAMGFMPSQTQQDIGAMYQQDAAQPGQNLQGYGAALQPYVNFGASGQAVANPGYQSPLQTGLGVASASYPFWQQALGSSWNPTPNVGTPVAGDAYMPGAGYSAGLFG